MPINPKDPVGSEMHKFKHGTLHSGSAKGPIVKNRKQAIAIGLSEKRKINSKLSAKQGGKKMRDSPPRSASSSKSARRVGSPSSSRSSGMRGIGGPTR